MYLVQTRCLGCPAKGEFPDLPINRFEPELGEWRPSSWQELVEDAPQAVVTIHVHGNRIDSPEAIARGWAVYHEWALRAHPETRLVFVTWSWPSSRIRGQMRDVRVKAARTPRQSFYLASLLSVFPPESPVSLTGHSFGSRIICGAAHLTAGGSLNGYRLPADRVRPTRNLRAVVMAAAMHNYWLSPGHRHGLALTQMDRMLVLYNSLDPVLRRYRYIERGARPQALGYTGAIFCDDAGELPGYVDQTNVACYLGKEHSFMSYLCAPAVADMAAPYVLFEPLNAP
jgi:hypothetical protein